MSSFLLIGEPGSGKTTAVCTAGTPTRPVGVIDFDYKLHKMENVKHLLRTKENPGGSVIQIPINHPLSMIGLKRLATTKHEQGGAFTVQQPKGYLEFVETIEKLQANNYVWDGVQLGALAIDSYTTMQEHLKRMLLAANGKSTMTQPLYGVFLTNLEEVNNTIIRMPIHTFLLLHQKLEKDELTGKITYRPMIEGQMQDKIGKDFEEIYYMHKEVMGNGAGAKATYQIMTLGDTMRTMARTSRQLPPIIECNFAKILGIK